MILEGSSFLWQGNAEGKKKYEGGWGGGLGNYEFETTKLKPSVKGYGDWKQIIRDYGRKSSLQDMKGKDHGPLRKLKFLIGWVY